MVAYLWLAIGIVATGCGIVGVFLPILPTTPFLLVAVFSFARSSPRLHGWLLEHPRLGAPVRDWQRYGVIPRASKVMALVVMTISLIGSWVFAVPIWALFAQAAMLAIVAAFILTRPSSPPPRLVARIESEPSAPGGCHGE